MQSSEGGLQKQHALIALLTEMFADFDPVLTASFRIGTADRWSDVDIMLREPADVAHVMRRMSGHKLLLAQFTADHIGLPTLLVTIWRMEDGIAKADIAVGETKTTEASPADVLLNRVIGWLVYTHAKIERGEFLEAASGLELLRAQAVVPLIRMERGLPMEGYRRLERLLPPELCARLWSFQACGPDRAALRAALDGTMEFLAAPDRLPPFGRDSRLETVIREIGSERSGG